MEVALMKDYEVVIGLEIHAELDTKTKAFCSCRNEFGALPNTQVCPGCLGLPGALPVLNKKAVEYTIMGGLSFGCDINNHVVFERKNYFYPDLPKSYQITQVSNPLCVHGGITLSSGKMIRFNRIHLEEDAGKLIHDANTNETLIDYNRSGIPLIEMVTEPDVSSAEEVVEFVNKLRQTLIYSGVSKCKMEEGGMRFDLNLSVKEKNADKLNNRCEIKNLGSLKSVEKAIEYESSRQIQLLKCGNEVKQETRGWNEETGETYIMREKEKDIEYRYLPDPDIISVEISDKEIARLKSRLPELIDSRKMKLKDLGLSDYDINILLSNKVISDYYMSVVDLTHEPKETANWVMTECLRASKESSKLELIDIITPENLSIIINKVLDGSLTRVNAKVLFDEIIKTGKDANSLIIELGLIGEVNKKDIIELIGMIINANPNILQDYKNSPDEVVNYFIGNIMKQTQGKAKVEYIKPLLIEILNK